MNPSHIFEVDTEELDFLARNGVPLRARIYRPRGRGPFPAMVDAHGGAWIQGSFVNNDPINRPIAAGGVVVMAIDYSLPPAGTYPSSVADMNYAIRWLKKHAHRYDTKPRWVGAMGTSSGGHLAVLAAIKPHDARYANLPLEGGSAFDADVACVVTMWPVICPRTRFSENVERQARGDQSYAARVGGGLDQMKYWLSEDNMSDGSPMLAVERGDKVAMPDVLYVQATGDNLHPRHCMDRFCAAYRKRGGQAEALLVEGEPYDFVRSKAECAEAKRAIKRMLEFIHECKARADRAPTSGSAG
jgi:acetyl esterase